jgi:hypothetical protein
MRIFLLAILASLSFSFWQCQSENGKTEKPEVVNSATKVSTQPKSSEGIRILVDDQTVTAGAEVCVDLNVKDFQQVVSMQYTFTWDPSALTFKEIRNLNLKDLAMGNFGLHRTAQGMIGISWFDQDIKGITLEDGTSIYQVCFQATGKPGSKSPISFTSEPVLIEISNTAGNIIELASRRAYITIE